VLVYPRKYTIVLSLAIAIPVLLLSLALAVSRLAGGAVAGGLAFAVLAVFAGYGTVVLIRQLVRPRPLARLDEEGLACAAGSVAWSDVDSVSTDTTYGPASGRKRRLWVRLAPGAELRPAEATFLDNPVFGRCRVLGSVLELPAWARKDELLADVRRFYSGPTQG
jgi:hypothetical protein